MKSLPDNPNTADLPNAPEQVADVEIVFAEHDNDIRKPSRHDEQIEDGEIVDIDSRDNPVADVSVSTTVDKPTSATDDAATLSAVRRKAGARGSAAQATRAGRRRADLLALIERIPLKPRWSDHFPVDARYDEVPSPRILAAALKAANDGRPPYPCGARTVARDLEVVWWGSPVTRERINAKRPASRGNHHYYDGEVARVLRVDTWNKSCWYGREQYEEGRGWNTDP